jgi:hypothetical protein
VTIRLYLDEDVDVALASALRQRGIDVLTTQEAPCPLPHRGRG